MNIPQAHHDGRSDLLFQGDNIPETPMIFDQITQERLDEVGVALDDLIDLWTVDGDAAKARILQLMNLYGSDFLIGDPWHNDFRRSPQAVNFHRAYPNFLDDDMEMHVKMSRMCAAEAMINVANRFKECIDRFDEDDPEAHLFGFDQSIFDFAGLVDHSSLAYDFINTRVLPWIESHGIGAFYRATLRDTDCVQRAIMDEFKWNFGRVDECFDPDHAQGTKAYQCSTCALNLCLAELREEWVPENYVPLQVPLLPAPGLMGPPPVPVRGGRGGVRGGVSRGTGAGVGSRRGTGSVRGIGRGIARGGVPSSNAMAAAAAAVAMGMAPVAGATPGPIAPPAAVPAAPIQPPAPPPAAPGQVSGTANLQATLQYIASIPINFPLTPVQLASMPTFAQFLAQGNTNPPAIADNYTPAAIYQRSAALTFQQRPESLIIPSIGGFRYLCNQILPDGTPCARYHCRRGDVIRHFRADHGGIVVGANQTADWAQMGPFNRFELSILRPRKVFSLASKNDPPHMKT